MVANVGFEFRDRNSIPIVCQIMDDSLRKVVYIVPQPRRWPPPILLAMRYLGRAKHSSCTFNTHFAHYALNGNIENPGT